MIVQGKGGNQAAHAVADVLGLSIKTARTFSSIDGVAVELTGAQILALAADKHVDGDHRRCARAPLGCAATPKWPYVTGVNKYWATSYRSAAPAATIAIVDSGIDAIAARVRRSHRRQRQPQLPPRQLPRRRARSRHLRGRHRREQSRRARAARRNERKIVSLDVMDDKGMARTSDVIAAADWILANKAKYGIRVANFSLHSSVANSFMYDPLDKAVERLWFNNVVVVAAAGNYGKPDGPSGVPFAPGNDPFVITVGASDTGKSVSTNDDVAAPWSAYGYTLDGFAKPELVAPGRYMVGPVPVTSTLYSERADHVVEPGLHGAFRHLLLGADRERHRRADPRQPSGLHRRSGQGRADARREADAGSLQPVGRASVRSTPGARSSILNPPNPNKALNAFIVTSPLTSARVFDAASWAAKARADASWADASWADASWADASWSAASWADASWSDASWASASWADTSLAAASWADLSLGSASWADNAADEPAAPDGGAIDDFELAAILAGTLDP